MPFPICKGSNLCVLESFQHIDELACIQNSDKCDRKHANWWKVALIRFLFFLSFLRGDLLEDVSVCLA